VSREQEMKAGMPLCSSSPSCEGGTTCVARSHHTLRPTTQHT
jgi:hypothetical protein